MGEISEAGLVPEVIFDSTGEEKARIYRDPRQQVNARVQSDGTVRIELGRRGDRGGALAYSLPLYGVSSPPPAAGPTPIESMNNFTLGQAVTWTDNGEARVGAIKEFKQDGTCLINTVSAEGLKIENIKVEKLSPVGDSK